MLIRIAKENIFFQTFKKIDYRSQSRRAQLILSKLGSIKFEWMFVLKRYGLVVHYLRFYSFVQEFPKEAI